MSRFIAIGDRAWVAPEHIKFVRWTATRNTFIDPVTGDEMAASVTIETYHNAYRIACRTPADAQRIAETIIADLGASDLERLTALPMLQPALSSRGAAR